MTKLTIWDKSQVVLFKEELSLQWPDFEILGGYQGHYNEKNGFNRSSGTFFFVGGLGEYCSEIYFL